MKKTKNKLTKTKEKNKIPIIFVSQKQMGPGNQMLKQ